MSYQLNNFFEPNYERGVLSETYHTVPFFSNGHLVRVRTSDDVLLHGFYNEPDEKTKKIFLMTHGSFSNFYRGSKLPYIESTVLSRGYSFLVFNNRGHDQEASREKIKDSLFDFDAWIAFAKAKGFEEIVLCGSSLSSQKIIYYLNHKENPQITQIILTAVYDAFFDWRKLTKEKGPQFVTFAAQLVEQGRGNQLMPKDACYEGELLTADAYLEQLGPDSVLHNFDFSNPQFDFAPIKAIKLPALVINGDKDFSLPAPEANFQTLKSIKPEWEMHLIKDAGHRFLDHEPELANFIKDFLL